MKGSEFLAVRRISDVDNETLAEPGKSCARVPTEALPGLLAAGDIERAPERRTPAPRRAGERPASTDRRKKGG